MLANRQIDDDQRETKQKSEQSADCGWALKIRGVIGSEKCQSSRQEAPNRNDRGQEAGCDGGPLENHPREGKDRIHAADAASSERTRGAHNQTIQRTPPDQVLHGATLAAVPTSRPRHTITETPPVQEALDELRRELGEDRVELPELVIRGAREKARELRGQSRAIQDARLRLARSIRTGAVDTEEARLADEAKQVGLSAEL